MLRLPLLKLCERRQTLFAISWKGLDGLVLSPLALPRSEEHTSELQSQSNLVCRLLLEKKKIKTHLPAVMRPCSLSQASPRSMVSKKLDVTGTPSYTSRPQSVLVLLHCGVLAVTILFV